MASTAKAAPTHIQRRLQHCRMEMQRLKVRNYLITNRADQIYLTGFDGEDGAALITPKDVYIISDGRFSEELQMQFSWAQVHLRRSDLAEAIATVLSNTRVRSVQYQSDIMTVALLSRLKRAAQSCAFRRAPGIVNNLRLCKDAYELKTIKKAINIAEQAFLAMRKTLRLGMAESDIAARLEYEMKRRGATMPSFRTIVAEGRNASLPHAEPGKRTLKKNSLLLIDWGAKYGHYCSDLTRVLFMGKIAPRLKLVYQITLEAQQKAIKAIRPGQRVCDVDQVARDHIAKAGFGDQFTHGLGHGIGIDIHEGPSLKSFFKDRLEAGMVVTVEPGIYLPGLGGVRIEDDVLVTERGHRVLSHLDRSLSFASAGAP